MKQRLILASGSPRRRSLLQECGLEPEVCPADVDESRLCGEAIADYVQRVAHSKTREVWSSLDKETQAEAVVLSADTMVVVDHQFCGKPADFAEACKIWERLGGRWHEVWTGVVLKSAQQEICTTVNTRVWMELLGPEEMLAYWRSGEPCDKSGAYALQGRGGRWIRAIDGSFSNVVGLPLVETLELLATLGITP